MYGDQVITGLVPQLNKRVGMLKTIAKHITKESLNKFVCGIFYSKLSYCLPVFGNVFGLEKYKETNQRYTSFTMRDCKKLQTLQNKVIRLLVDVDPLTPTTDLLHMTGSLSVHQLVAYQTIIMVRSIIENKKPKYIADKLRPIQGKARLRTGTGNLNIPQYKLSLSREGFVYRGAYIYNLLDETIKKEENLGKFKDNVKGWVKRNISIKPKSNFSSISERIQINKPGLRNSNNLAPTLHASNPITRYFKPLSN